jgi:signal transduction histidine kinase
MSQWVGGELERRFVAEEREVFAEHQRELASSEHPGIRRHEARAARAVDVNAAIHRSEKNLRGRIDSDVALELNLAAGLIEAARLPVAVGSIVESIVAQAVAALSGAGLITIKTADLELTNRDPDLVPAIAPNHYVTASVTATGSHIEADSFAHAFDPPADDPHRGTVWDLQSDLPLATIYRLLQRSGGDLSVEIEPGRSCTFTVFLPAADSPPERPRPAEGTPQPLRLN